MERADLELAVTHYRELAPRYDHFTRRINRIRERTIDALQLQPGRAVLDAGCGTGWCFSRLAERIGRPAVLIPTDDAGSIFLAEHGEQLRPSFLFPAPPAGLLSYPEPRIKIGNAPQRATRLVTSQRE